MATATKPKRKIKAREKGAPRKAPVPTEVPFKRGCFVGKWQDAMAFKLYDLLKSGMPLGTAAGVLGVRKETVYDWAKNLPIAKAAVKAATLARTAESESFQDYVYGNLPADLRPVWREIMTAGDGEDAVERIEAAMAGQGKRGRQYLFLHALVNSNFNISEASRKTNIERRTFQLWCKTDDGFARIIDEIHQSKKDLAEGGLFKLVAQGDTSAVLFANRTLNKDRGFGDSKTITVDQTTTHRHLIDIDQLELSLEVRKAIMLAVRKAQSPDEVAALPAVRKPVDVIDAEILNEDDE